MPVYNTMYFAVDPIQPNLFLLAAEELRTRCAPNVSVHALVDKAFDHEQRVPEWMHEGLPLYRGKLEALQKVSPVLLTLPVARKRRDEALHELMRHCTQRPMLSLIFTPMFVEELIEQWQALVTCRTEDGERLLLRFADTRVSPVLALHLRASLWARLTDELAGWLVPDREGRPCQLGVQIEMQASDEETADMLPNEQLAALLDASRPDTVLDSLAEQVPEMVRASVAPRSTVYAWATHACELTRAHGLDRLADEVALTAAALLTNGYLLEDARLPAVLDRHRQDPAAPLHDLLTPLLP